MSTLREAGLFAILAALPLVWMADGGEASIRGSAPLPAEIQATQGRNCPISTLPGVLPDIATVVDVDALRPALAAELAQAPASGRMLFSIRFKPDGQREWVESIGGEADSEQLRLRIARLIAEHIKNQAAGEPWSLRLQVVPGEPLQLHVSHSRVCPVELVRPDTRAPFTVTRSSRADLESLQQAGPARVTVHVSATGTVLRVDFLQRSGSHVADDNVARSARANRYRPAMVDGIPVAGQFVLEARPFVQREIRRN